MVADHKVMDAIVVAVDHKVVADHNDHKVMDTTVVAVDHRVHCTIA